MRQILLQKYLISLPWQWTQHINCKWDEFIAKELNSTANGTKSTAIVSNSAAGRQSQTQRWLIQGAMLGSG